MKILVWVTVIVSAGCLLVTSCSKADAALTPSGKGFELAKVSDQSVNQSSSETVKVSIDRKGGFDGPVTVEVSGLPAGVTVDGGATQTIQPKDSSINLKLLIADTAATSDKNAITVRVSATVDGTTLTRQDVFNLKVKSRT